MAETNLLQKYQLETSLHNERKLIEAGKLKEDNPLDISEPFRVLCEACRGGDLKVCQEKITEGVNINARDLFDYTPLILVSPFLLLPSVVATIVPVALALTRWRPSRPAFEYSG